MQGEYPEDWAKLSVDQRISLCLAMAIRMRRIASVTGHPASRDHALELASRWDVLAFELAKKG